MKNYSRLTVLILLLLPMILGSCSIVEGIFKAGMGFGIFLVVIVIGGIVALVMRAGKK